MKFCIVKDEYIELLYSKDNQVMMNHKGRPYICCLIKIQGMEYLVPITTNRITRKYDLDIKIKRSLSRNDIVGHVKPCKMIPGHQILYDVVSFKDIKDNNYKKLLGMTYDYLNQEKILEKIIVNCNKAYNKKGKRNNFVKFKTLKTEMIKYIKEKYKLDVSKSSLADKIDQINMIQKPIIR